MLHDAARLLAEIGEARELERVREELAERHRRALRNPPPEIARWFPVGAFGELREDWPE